MTDAPKRIPKGTPHRKKRQMRLDVFRRDLYTCQTCGCTDRDQLTLDHVVPKSKGGKSTRANLQVLCYDCNQEKADRLNWKE